MARIQYMESRVFAPLFHPLNPRNLRSRCLCCALGRIGRRSLARGNHLCAVSICAKRQIS